MKVDDSTACIPLPFYDNPCDVYARLRPVGQAVLLDSGGDSERGRFDIIAAAADRDRSLCIESSTAQGVMQKKLRDWCSAADAQTPTYKAPGHLPFYGGYIGQLSYELGRRLQGLTHRTDSGLPVATVHYYPWAVVQDHKECCSWLVGELDAVNAVAPRVKRLLSAERAPRDEEDFCVLGRFASHWSLQEYQERFEAVKNHIAQGDCYQINIGQGFSAPYGGDLFSAYQALRDVARAPFSGFFPLTPVHSLLSLSPERFLTVDGGRVETRPIKGTRPRHKNATDDQAAAHALLGSDKERAENLMIVDLLRNDIGRYCTAGTVRVPELFSIESYATVHHLVSVVTGELSAQYTAIDLLLGSMPGGSITGAPKHRAMHIIDELEPAARGPWCGSLFYLSRHGRLDSNIAIRTLFNEDQTLHCWAGGGLVADSQLEAEYQEQRDKVGAFLATLENTLPSVSQTAD